MSTASSIEAWIDVGGTFTDCILRITDHRSGTTQLRRGKSLSSGRVPISCDRSRTGRNTVSSIELAGDCDAFWVGATLSAFDVGGGKHWTVSVVNFTNGLLQLDNELPFDLLRDGSDLRFELDPHCEAPVLVVRRLLQTPLASPLPPMKIRMGTTKGTNALLTRRGANTALAITAPFVDLLAIGDQTRPDLFALAVTKPEPLCNTVVAIAERLDATGAVVEELNVENARAQLRKARDAGAESLAICLMHAYLNPIHELALEELARQVGFEQISVSSRLAPVIELVARSQTTVVDAYLSPIVRSYLSTLVAQFGGTSQVQMAVMTSAGGLIDWHDYTGKDSILSGPAGGVTALRGISQSTNRAQIIGLDMGGTSTDVCRVTENQELQFESTKAGVRILTPTLPIETVASGGGSICWFDGVSLRVGPQSAGASPGPACYGRGGPLTITDVNFFLSRIPARQFPFPTDRSAVNLRLEEILAAAGEQLGSLSPREVAMGFRAIANEQMADAVRTVSIAQGADPRAHTLVGFGGAAGQHICEIAESLGVQEVIDSSDAGILSALGMGLAVERLDAVLAVYKSVDQCDWPAIDSEVNAEEMRLTEQLHLHSESKPTLHCSRSLEARYLGTDATITIPWNKDGSLASDFHEAHRRRFGYVRQNLGIEVVAVRLACQTAAQELLPSSHEVSVSDRSTDQSHERSSDRMPEVEREELVPGQSFNGPAIVLNAGSTLVVEANWTARVNSDGSLVLHHSPPKDDLKDVPQAGLERERLLTQTGRNPGGFPAEAEQAFDPILRDCIGQRLSAIATQMGLMLQQTAVSVNVKQRRDFSCAIFDSSGQLLANAPHVPVHLGAMGKTVRAILNEFGDIAAGDVFITNDPYKGGSHLPDVTVITPVFSETADSELSMFVANRAHHADIGGLTPGSMSVRAKHLGEEGVIISPRRLITADADLSDELRSLLVTSKHPPRNVAENMADIAAQVAANVRGVGLLNEYAATLTWSILKEYSSHLLDAAELRVLQFLQRCEPGRKTFADHMDDGTPIHVALEFASDGRLKVDFTGTGGTSRQNFNANPSIVTAALMYVLRCLIADDLPLNEGVMRCVDIRIPESCLLNPTADRIASLSPAVAAGNVETSQRVVDVLLGAFGVAAASQGTMNNLLFGNATFGFYETICGGAGATEGYAGASGIHTHMTNTRLTDPEVLETRYPVRLVEFRLRAGSGGSGRWRGGDGVVRTVEFLEEVEASLLTSRRGQYPPFGLYGGKAGQIGHNTLIDAAGNRTPLDACAQFVIKAGQRLEIQTPGGGGFGT